MDERSVDAGPGKAAKNPLIEDFLSRWEQRRPVLLQRCLRFLGGHRADAEDALARALVTLLDGPVSLDEVQNPDAWLSQVVRNSCMDIHRNRKRHPTESIEDRYQEGARALAPSMRVADDPEGLLLQREAIREVSLLVDALPQDLRIPLVLRIDEGVQYKDLAARLSLTEENLRKRVQLARQMLAPDVERYYELGVSALRPRDREALGAAPEALDWRGLDGSSIPPARVLHPIRVALPTGADRRVWLMLDARPPTYTARRHERLARYVEKHPSGWKIRLDLGDMLLGAGKFEEAARCYRDVLRSRKRVWPAYPRLAQCLSGAGRGDGAADVLADLEGASPEPATCLHLRGLFDLSRGRAAEAEASLERALALDPRNSAHAVALGMLALSRGRPVEALAAFEQALAVDPENEVALVLGHDAAAWMGRTRHAEALLARAFALDVPSVATFLRVVERRCGSGDTGRETDALARKLVRLWPALAEAHACRAIFCRATGRWDKAREVLRAFVTAEPEDAMGWLSLARGSFATGDYVEAVAAVERALSLDPGSASAYEEAIRIFATASGDEGRGTVDEALRRFEGHWPIVTGAARALAAWGKADEEAIGLSERACRAAPSLSSSWFNHGEVLALTGRWAAAAESFTRGLALSPADDGHVQSTPALLWLASLAQRAGDGRGARTFSTLALDGATRAMPYDVGHALYWQGKAREGLGDLAAARASYQAALARHVEYPARGEVETALLRVSGG